MLWREYNVKRPKRVEAMFFHFSPSRDGVRYHVFGCWRMCLFLINLNMSCLKIFLLFDTIIEKICIFAKY